MKTLEQAIKYGLVGVSNTLITMVVIWLMLKTLGLPEGLSNFTGYVAGLLNSYIWNRQWTFKGSTLLQYGLVLLLNKYLPIDHYYNHLIGMVFYTFLNFVMNKFYTFKM